MDTCVIYNPTAGRGRAERLVNQLRKSQKNIDFRPTSQPGEGSELAQRAIQSGHSRIIAAGGDGTVHEVANGVLAAEAHDVVFGVWPIGSANDYAYALGVHGDWPLRAGLAQSAVRAVDVGRVTGGGRSRYFVNGLGLGFNSAVTLEAQSIPQLRGMALYGLAFLRAVWRHFDSPTVAVTLDGRSYEQATLALTVNLGKREGGFLVTPRADLSDALFDVVHAGALSRLRALALLPRLVTGTLPADHPLIRQTRCRRATISAREPLRIHLDGEFFCHCEDGVCKADIDLLPGRLKVMTPMRS
jgi:diacylglycerol kinase (ATP)